MHILYEICPYLKFGYMAANGAIAEACKNEDRIHIIDFQIAQGTQWLTLLQAFAARPSGAPHVRITGIDDPVSKYARGDGLAAVARRLAAISEKFNIPVEFHAVPVFAPDITREMLDVRPGEALAVNFPLQLHHTPDESVDVSNPRDGLLRMVNHFHPRWSLWSSKNQTRTPHRFSQDS
ncbi:UNVERIFIED_CONTAM: Chitin-inducible gibberellin-responsive protein 1 [Sesamum radiatum]|uniref:Chitin-inducible gibberellin-responsive protein 1 n=1 Tax=Sesamum radiatum TaxID=300843 RepID=A0AAW2JDK7_SESRA